MAKQLQQRLDGIEVSEHVIKIGHRSDHVHLVDTRVQLYFRFHEPETSIKVIETDYMTLL